MQDPVIVIGTGEMGGVFTRGLLRLGHPIYPVNRKTDLDKISAAVPDPRLVLVAVGENDLHSTLDIIPRAWHDHLGLLQNELLPGDWKRHDISNPTVISVWFEKKKGQDFKILIPSPIYGPQASLLENALARLEIPSWELDSEEELEYELVRKNVYILTTNIAGLAVGGNVDDLWFKHRDLARQVANEVMDIQAWLVGHHLDRERLIEGMVEGIKGDLQHKCMGRSAPGRLARAIEHADQAELKVPKLREIHAQQTSGG
jgi:ketopantoate reductase